MPSFDIQPIERFGGRSAAIKRPRVCNNTSCSSVFFSSSSFVCVCASSPMGKAGLSIYTGLHPEHLPMGGRYRAKVTHVLDAYDGGQ